MWQERTENGKSKLERTFEFKNFSEAWAFMSRVALLAESKQHHPDWANVYSKVTIRLSTHDAGDTVTEKDRELAEAIDRIMAG